MLTIDEIVAREKTLSKKPDVDELRRLPDRMAEIHGRLSGWNQVKTSEESVREISVLVALAKQDGYRSGLEPVKVEKWLADIQARRTPPDVLVDGEIIVNCLGLGVSGSLPEEKRSDLAPTMDQLKKGALGVIYVTEGPNRLARDPDMVVPAVLLKLMKETNCKLRTPREILSPRIERDWESIRAGFEQGAGELKVMQIRLQDRKARKAARGEFVGEPIPAGFILPILDRKPTGAYQYGKMEPYPPHADVCTRILQEYERQRHSPTNTVRALRGLTLPLFPPDLRYMERLSSLRACRRTEAGYHITPAVVRGVATNLKAIGVWKWGRNERKVIIRDNHSPAVPKDLFLRNYEPGSGSGKPRGRAINHEPLEWDGLLWDYNHPDPYPVSSLASCGEYRCHRDYRDVVARHLCLSITSRFLDEPLTAEVLSQLDFTPFAQKVLSELQDRASDDVLQVSSYKRRIAGLERKLSNLKSYLGGDDRAMELIYQEKIRATLSELDELRTAGVPKKAIAVGDIEEIRNFLKGLPDKWRTYPRGLRNRVLKHLVAEVQLRHDLKCINALIVWKAGLQQPVIIPRPAARGSRDKRWTEPEKKALETLWPSSDRKAIEAALPDRTWDAITAHAHRFGLKRPRKATRGWECRPWSPDEEVRVRSLYEGGIAMQDMVAQLNRTENSIVNRAKQKGWRRPASAKWKRAEVTWQCDSLRLPYEVSSERCCLACRDSRWRQWSG